MKEAFDLIRKRIGEITIDRSEEGIIRGCNMGICLDDDCLKCLKKKILSIVSEVEAEYGNGWIDVKDRLPNKEEYNNCNGQFIVSDGNRTYATYFDIYDTLKFGEPTMNGFRVDRCVIAWMPLPEPYKLEK